MFYSTFRRLGQPAKTAAAAAAADSATNDDLSKQQQQKSSSAKPLSATHPDLEGYVSKRAAAQKRPRWIPAWIPANRQEYIRWKVSRSIWFDFDARPRIQMLGGAFVVGTCIYLFVCWVDNVSPYLAVSEDPNTAFKHPYWVEKANERVQRERDIKTRLASSTHGAGGEEKPQFSALGHAFGSYSSQNAGDRLSA